MDVINSTQVDCDLCLICHHITTTRYSNKVEIVQFQLTLLTSVVVTKKYARLGTLRHRMILKWILKKQDMGLQTRLVWIRIETSDELL